MKQEVLDLKQQRTILFWLLFIVAGIGANATTGELILGIFEDT